MEITEVTFLGLENGMERKKISFINPNRVNTMAESHKYYTRDQKKEAKANHKANV